SDQQESPDKIKKEQLATNIAQGQVHPDRGLSRTHLPHHSATTLSSLTAAPQLTCTEPYSRTSSRTAPPYSSKALSADRALSRLLCARERSHPSSERWYVRRNSLRTNLTRSSGSSASRRLLF